jgi:hypothetical protein
MAIRKTTDCAREYPLVLCFLPDVLSQPKEGKKALEPYKHFPSFFFSFTRHLYTVTNDLLGNRPSENHQASSHNRKESSGDHSQSSAAAGCEESF